MTIENFKKVIDYFEEVYFCGQISDPIFHPQFTEFLKLLKGKRTVIHTAASHKKEEWYRKAFEANTDAYWTFGIDGLPKDSHKYRTNQDGEKLYEMLKIARKHLHQKPIWQFIVFAYNENDIDEAHQMAIDIDVDFMIVNSSRWLDDNDPFKPVNPKHSLTLT